MTNRENRTNKTKSTQCCAEECYQQRNKDLDAVFDAYRYPTCDTYSHVPPNLLCQTQQQHEQQQHPISTKPLTDSGQLAETLNEITENISKQYLQRREPALYRQVITVPGPPGKVLQTFRRLPTPSPDVFQRVFVIKPERDIIDLLISKPTSPQTLYNEKTIYARPHRPLIVPRIVETVPNQSTYAGFNPQTFDPSTIPSANPFSSYIPHQMNQQQQPTSVFYDPTQQRTQDQNYLIDPQFNNTLNLNYNMPNLVPFDMNNNMYNNMYV